MKSKTRTIKIQENKIMYTLKCDGMTDYLSFDETLLSILKLDRLKPFRDNERLRFKIRENGIDINMYLYDIAFACYSKQVKKDTFIYDMQKYLENKSFNGLTIDHIDNNVRNNTRYNLSLMESTINQNKNSIVARVKVPTYLNAVYHDNKYRVRMAWKVPASRINNIFGKFFGGFTTDTTSLVTMHFICENAESFVNCLKFVTTSKYEWALPLKQKGKWVNNDNLCWSKNINNSIKTQELLVNMREDEFQLYKPITD